MSMYGKTHHNIVISLQFKNKLIFKKSHCVGFPNSSVGKESACNAGDPASIPRLGGFPGEVKDYPFQYSGLENSWTV